MALSFRPQGILERAIGNLKREAYHQQKDGTFARYVTLESIARFNAALVAAEYDTHNIISGQNGSGKSFLQLALVKKQLEILGFQQDFIKAEQEGKLKFMYAFNKRKELTEEIRARSDCVFAIDELRVFFDYKQSWKNDQNNLYNMIEVARSHHNIYIGCTRELDKIDNNYRNAKANLMIRVWDRVGEEGKTEYSFGSVFVGNPAIEMEDKFMQNALDQTNSIGRAMYIAERLPTFVGSIIVKPISNYGVSEEDIKFYLKQKEKGILHYSNIYKDVKKHGNKQKGISVSSGA